jgi:tetratricopeptide (TPR) repeat protein
VFVTNLDRVRDLLGEDTTLAPAEADSGEEDLLPRPFGRYELLSVVGRGGFGTVYAAHDPELDRQVAVKVMLLGADLPLERFLREARTVASLAHAHVVPIHEVGEEEGRAYLVMDFVDGETLDLIELSPHEVAEVLATVAETLHFVHEAGVIHRDLKPHNLMRDDKGHVWVMDFGLARKLEGGTSLTRAGQVMGTPAYMAPEQARGERADARSDVYALGATLYRLLARRPPFRAPILAALLAQVESKDPRPPSTYAREVPRDLDTICLAALEKEPAARYPSARALAEDLRRFLAHEPLVARPPSLAERGMKWLRRNRGLAVWTGALVAVFLISALVAGVAFTLSLKQERDEAYAARRTAETATAARDDALAEVLLQKSRAEERARLAQRAVDALIHEVRKELGDLPGVRLRQARQRLLRLACENLLSLEKLKGLEGDPAAPTADAVEAHRQLGSMAIEARLPRAALAATTSATVMARRLPQGAREGPLAFALRTRAEALRLLGRVEEGRADLKQATALRRALLKAESNQIRRRDLALALIDEGRAALSDSAPEDAKGVMAEALQLSVALKKERSTAETTLAISLSAGGLARAARQLGKLDEALPPAKRCLALRRKLVARDPGGVSAQQNLLAALHEMGELLVAREDLDGAAKAYTEMTSIARDMARRDPESGISRDNLALAGAKLGELALRRGQPQAALKYVAEGLEAGRGLLSSDPSNHEARERVAVLLRWRARVLEIQRDLPAARDAFLVAAKAYRGTSETGDLADCLERAGDMSAMTRDLKGAETHFREALALRRQRWVRYPESQQARSRLARALTYLGRVLVVAGQRAQGRTTLEEALSTWKATAKGEERTRQLLLVHKALGDAALNTLDFARARKHLQAALASKAPNEGERKELEAMLHATLLGIGERKPSSGQDHVRMAYFALASKKPGSAVGHFESAFQAEPRMRTSKRPPYLYQALEAAAKAAAKAGAGGGHARQGLGLAGGIPHAMARELQRRSSAGAAAEASRNAQALERLPGLAARRPQAGWAAVRPSLRGAPQAEGVVR